ncbi:MAG: nicotinate-nucleotide adenylyltransferase [Gammaproteobacteria bacterium]|nr:nicotinate-nucleotide adenylyltransferase [Gammaproteobacteria bacterium]MDH3449777.1 nicotinate-nucleotide adenylyltransferase [Gammaproteobacteria bacterium]
MIGILGGTFDPIHNGHLHLATEALSRLELEQVQLMPCALPVHRDQPHATAQQRCAMIELALSGQAGLVLNTLEIERDGPSYMIDSLREIHARGDVKIALLLGTDAFNGFAGWKHPRQILELAHLVVCIRPGAEPDRGLYPDRRVASPRELSRLTAGAILLLEIGAIDCSSSEVRAALEGGDIPRRCLPPAVADYIETHHLYRRPGD